MQSRLHSLSMAFEAMCVCGVSLAFKVVLVAMSICFIIIAVKGACSLAVLEFPLCREREMLHVAC